MKVFFCHASEDKPFVERVFTLLGERHPDVQGWLDKFEILGGDVLIDKITDGIQSADKFVVFLSAVSVTKPWVNHELRQAFAKEIAGVDPAFIIPVKVGEVPGFPAFLSPKKYLDTYNLTEDELLEELYRAIVGDRPTPDAAELVQNLEGVVLNDASNPRLLGVQLTPRFTAEPIAFKAITSVYPYESVMWTIPGHPGGSFATAEVWWDNGFAVQIHNERLQPGQRFLIIFTFPAGVDTTKVVLEAHHWDGDRANARHAEDMALRVMSPSGP